VRAREIVVVFAPIERFPAAVVAVAAYQDPDLGPVLGFWRMRRMTCLGMVRTSVPLGVLPGSRMAATGLPLSGGGRGFGAFGGGARRMC